MPEPDLPAPLEGVHHLALFAVDLEPMTRFYRDVLGLAELTRHFTPQGLLRSVWLALDDTGGFLALEQGRGTVEGQKGLGVLAFRISPHARAAWEHRLVSHGHPAHHHTAWTFYVRDPEGNTVAFSHHPHAAVDGRASPAR